MSTYHGHVKVGGPPEVRELADLIVSKVAVGPMDNNAYLLRCRSSGAQILIDAANDAQTLLELVGDRLEAVITTHRHADHWQALSAVVSATSTRTTAGREDAEGIPVPTDDVLDDGSQVRFGEIVLTAIHLVGHTPGGVALLYDDPTGHPHLFTGDSLFPGGPGNTWGNRENFERLMTDLEQKVFGRLPDETWVYPGHGADTTLGAERPSLPEWWARGW